MAIPLLAYAPSCPNQRVAALGAPDDQATVYSTDNQFSPGESIVILRKHPTIATLSRL